MPRDDCADMEGKFVKMDVQTFLDDFLPQFYTAHAPQNGVGTASRDGDADAPQNAVANHRPVDSSAFDLSLLKLKQKALAQDIRAEFVSTCSRMACDDLQY